MRKWASRFPRIFDPYNIYIYSKQNNLWGEVKNVRCGSEMRSSNPSKTLQYTVDVFAIFSPVFSLRIFYKKHAKNHTSNKPRAFKICVQLSFDKLIWYTKFHKDWSTRRQKHHWSKFFDGLVKYRTENRKTVHCAMYTIFVLFWAFLSSKFFESKHCSLNYTSKNLKKAQKLYRLVGTVICIGWWVLSSV